MMTVIRVELTVQIEYAVFLSKRLVKKKKPTTTKWKEFSNKPP